MPTPTREASLLPGSLNAKQTIQRWSKELRLSVFGIDAHMGGGQRKAGFLFSPAYSGGPGPVGVIMLNSLIER